MAQNKIAGSLKRAVSSADKLLKKAERGIRPDHKDECAIQAAMLKSKAEKLLSACGGAHRIASLAGHKTVKTVKRKK